jgi:hypothetical protein
VERTADILHGPALKAAFRSVRSARLPSGRVVPFPNAPISALSLEPYVDPMEAGRRHRIQQQQQQSVSGGGSGGDGSGGGGGGGGGDGRPQFATAIHRDRLKPPSQTLVAGRRKIQPVSAQEKQGAAWHGSATIGMAGAAAVAAGGAPVCNIVAGA